MTKFVGLMAPLLVGLGLVAGALAAGAEDDYGYGTTTAVTSTTVSTTGTTSSYSYKAFMTAKKEVPPPTAAANAAGTFNAKVTEKNGTASIRWTLTFARLSGKAVAAHIHKGKAGLAGPVVVPLCGPCRNGQNKRQAIDEDVAEALEKGGYYVNVHTAKNPAGEIRGQLKLVGR